jgi:hypothetical protein
LVSIRTSKIAKNLSSFTVYKVPKIIKVSALAIVSQFGDFDTPLSSSVSKESMVVIPTLNLEAGRVDQDQHLGAFYEMTRHTNREGSRVPKYLQENIMSYLEAARLDVHQTNFCEPQ